MGFEHLSLIPWVVLSVHTEIWLSYKRTPTIVSTHILGGHIALAPAIELVLDCVQEFLLHLADTWVKLVESVGLRDDRLVDLKLAQSFSYPAT
jgi:hypothetical protein